MYSLFFLLSDLSKLFVSQGFLKEFRALPLPLIVSTPSYETKTKCEEVEAILIDIQLGQQHFSVLSAYKLPSVELSELCLKYRSLETMLIVLLFPRMECFCMIAELHAWREAPRVSRARDLSNTTHPRKFGNHVTVHRATERPSAPQGNKCLLSHFLASLGVV